MSTSPPKSRATSLRGVSSPIRGPVHLPTPNYSSTQLTGNLSGAIGCDFSAASSTLVFVEFGGTLASLAVAPATPGLAVLGTGYDQPEDVKLSADGVHAYVTERSGDLVRVALMSADRSTATVVAAGLVAPQQLALDEAHGAAYVVEFTTPGRLTKIDLTTGTKTTVCGALENPVGVALSADLQTAYVSEQTSGSDLGRISAVRISNGVRTTLAKGLTAPFFLTWADSAQDSLFVPQRDPANSLLRVSVTSGAMSTVATNLPFRPSCVALPSPSRILVCCDAAIEEIDFTPVVDSSDLLISIGNIPFDAIDQTTGLATVSSSIFNVTNAPFGGALPLFVNFAAATAAAAKYYQVLVDGVVWPNAWNTFEWNGTANVPVTIAPLPVTSGATGCFPIPTDIDAYVPPSLGDILDSTLLSNDLHKIAVQFLDEDGNALVPALASATLQIMVNNQSCVAVLQEPMLDSASAGACGVLYYEKSTDLSAQVTIAYTASQPQNYATYSLDLVRGTTDLSGTFSLPSEAAVSAAEAPISETVAAFIGPCVTAGFALELYVAATMTNGESRQSQYDAQALIGFAIAESTQSGAGAGGGA